jgi:hypothetical protein
VNTSLARFAGTGEQPASVDKTKPPTASSPVRLPVRYLLACVHVP